MAIIFPGEGFAPIKPDLESIESFDNSQVGGIEKFGAVSSDVVSIEDVLPLTGGTMTGPILLAASAAGNTDGSIRFQTGTAPTSPTEGAQWNDSTQKTLITYLDSIKQGHVGCLFSQTATVTVASTDAETTVLGAGIGTLTLPVNFFVIGKTIRVRAMGIFSDTGTPNITMTYKLGSTTIMSTGAVALAGTISNNSWMAEGLITCRTVGATGTVFGQGYFEYDESTHAGTRLGMAATAAVTVDTTSTLAVNLTVTWGTNSASNTMSCTNFILEVLY